MVIYKTIKKTNEELYEGWMRNDFSSERKVGIAIVLENVCLILKHYMFVLTGKHN